ncbi:MAG: hypothetical protein AAF989_12810, partial [Planctomycetota bacterium]
ADNLVAVFNQEFDGLLSVVANDFDIHAQLDESVRPVRLIGSEGDIEGQSVRIPLAQLYANQQRYFIIETEVAAGKSDSSRNLADVEIRYRNLQTETEDRLASSIQVRFSDSEQTVLDAKDMETYAYCSLQVTSERNRKATALRDAGQVEEAELLLKQNADYLSRVQLECVSKGVTEVLPQLKRSEQDNLSQSNSIADPSKWNALRKGMRHLQNSLEQQQTYGISLPNSSSVSKKNAPKAAVTPKN